MKPIPCPTCKREVAGDAPTYPFCSPRCRLVDLGNWLGGKYAIPGEPAPDAAAPAGDGEGPDDSVNDEPGRRHKH